MASHPPTLPPAAFGNLSAKAKMDHIAVRLIFVPDLAKNTTQYPVKVSGTVSGANPDGSMTVKTDHGEIRILLKDRASLPTGLQIDLEIPPGRTPQQAYIKPNSPSVGHLPDTKPAETSETVVLQSLQNKLPPDTARANELVKITADKLKADIPLPLSTKLQTETLRDVISSIGAPLPAQKSSPLSIAGGMLQAGQMIRLHPLAPNSLPIQISGHLPKPLDIIGLISNLIDQIESLPNNQIALRQSLITVLSRFDPALISTAFRSSQSPETPSILDPLINKMNSLFQSIGASPLFKSVGTILFPNEISGSLSLFNPSKSVDGEIISLPSISRSQNGLEGTSALTLSSTSETPKPKLQTTLQTTLQTIISPAQTLGFTDDGLPILSVPLPGTGLSQTYTLQFKANNLEIGSPVLIALDPTSTKPSETLLSHIKNESLLTEHHLSYPVLSKWIHSGTWDSLDDLLKNLTYLSPPHADSFARIIPNPANPSSIPALSLFFLSLLRSGQMDGWIPNETLSFMRQMGKNDILRSVTSDMMITSRLETIPLPQDWRMTVIPFLWEHQIHKAPVYYKQFSDKETQDQENAEKRRKLRFLFDLNLSRMGDVQVDGFMQSTRLDMILRTKSPLSPPMQREMKKIYAGAMDKSHLTGDLSFQFKPDQWVNATDFATNSTTISGFHV